MSSQADFVPTNYLGKLNELIPILDNPKLNGQVLCEHLYLQTFSDLSPELISISEITSLATIRRLETFGTDLASHDFWKEVPLTLQAPVTESVRNSVVTVVNTLPHWPETYHDIKDVAVHENFKTFIAFPILRMATPVGVIGIFTSKKIDLEPKLEAFLVAIGNLISLTLFNHARDVAKPSHLPVPGTLQGLSERQLEILDLVAQQLTNAKIANCLGYSESTVRQETMKIFNYLGVEGRIEASRIYFDYQASNKAHKNK